MAFGVAGIESVIAWTAASEYADDNVEDADSTTCMLNGTLGQDCDEWKEGTLNGKVIIDHDPASILTLSVRFYLNSIMTAGDNDLVPYTDINSVSSTNKVTGDYSSAGVWVEHACSAAFIAELGDIGGGKCAVRLASPGGAKSKIGEVNIDITVQTYELAGITRDVDDAVLISCEYNIYKRTGLAPEAWTLFVNGTSHGTTGVFAEEVSRATYRIITVKDVAPQVQHISPPMTMAEAEADDDILTLGTFSGLANDDQVEIYQAVGDALPTGLSIGTTYHVVSQSGDTCKLSLTQGGAAINITVDGVCWIVGKPELS
jgi:hypothetical protein